MRKFFSTIIIAAALSGCTAQSIVEQMVAQPASRRQARQDVRFHLKDKNRPRCHSLNTQRSGGGSNSRCLCS